MIPRSLVALIPLLAGCAAASGQSSGGIKQENVGLKAELSVVRNDLTARDAEINGLKTTVEARDVEIAGFKATVEARDVEIAALKVTVGDVSGVKNEAGGDVNSSWVFAVAIVLLGIEPPALILAYMVANRITPLRRMKDWVKGCSGKRLRAEG